MYVYVHMHMAMYTHSMYMYIIYIYNIWVHYRKTNLFGWQAATRWFHIQIFLFSTRDAWVPWPGELVERCWDQMLLANRRFDDRFNAAFYRLERVRSHMEVSINGYTQSSIYRWNFRHKPTILALISIVMGVHPNSWMVDFMEHLIQMDDLVGPLWLRKPLKIHAANCWGWDKPQRLETE